MLLARKESRQQRLAMLPKLVSQKITGQNSSTISSSDIPSLTHTLLICKKLSNGCWTLKVPRGHLNQKASTVL